MPHSLPRVTPQAPGGLVQGRVVAQGVPAFARPKGAGQQQSEVVDFGPIAGSIGQFLREEAAAKGQAEIEKGRAFVLSNPELVQEIEADAEGVEGQGGIDGLRDKFRQLVESGQIPEAASPFFQIGFIEQRARAKATEVRSALIAQLPALTNVQGDEDPPDIAQVMAEAFAEASGSSVVSSFYGQAAFNAARSQVEDEITRRFDEGRAASIQADHRARFSDSVGSAMQTMALADPGDRPAFIGVIETVIEDEGRKRNIRGVRQVVVAELERVAEDLGQSGTDEDISQAIDLVRQMRPVRIGGRQLDEEGSSTASTMNNLVHRLRNQRDERQSDELSLRNQAFATVKVRSKRMGYAIMNEYRANGQSISAGKAAALEAILDDPENAEILAQYGITEGDKDHLEYVGLIQQELQQISQAMKGNLGRDDTDTMATLRRSLFDGDSAESILAAAEEAMKRGDMTPETFNDFELQVTGQAAVSSYMSNPQSLYRVSLLDPLNERIDPGFSEATQNMLRGLSRRGKVQGYGALLTAAAPTGTDSERLRAMDEKSVSQEVAGYRTPFEDARAEATTRWSKGSAEINGAIAGFQFEEAERLIALHEGDSISVGLATEMRKALTRKQLEFGNIKGSSPQRFTGASEVRQAVNQVLRIRGEEEDTVTTRDAVDRYLALFDEGMPGVLQNPDLTARASGMEALKASAFAEIVDPFQPADVSPRRTAGEFDLADVGDTRRDAAVEVYRNRASMAAFHVEQRVRGIDAETYERGDQIGDDPWFPIGVGATESEARTIRAWDLSALSFAEGDRGEAYASLHGIHFIPFDAVTSGIPINFEHSGLRGRDLDEIPGLERFAAIVGEAGKERVRQALPGVDVTFQPSKVPGEEGFFTATIKGSITLGPKANLQGFGTRYFGKIGEYDELPDTRKRKFLRRLGFNVEEDFGRADERFRADQVQVIRYWTTKKGGESE